LPRLLSTDARLILPAEKPILLSISSTDVLHAFAVPNFGLKVDAVPGRINTFWLYMNKAGIYYGQCSELCGKGHGFMPIVVDSQHYSNNPFVNEILQKSSSFFPVANADWWSDEFPEDPADKEGPGIDGYDHIRDRDKGPDLYYHDYEPMDFYADRGFGYHFGDGPTFLMASLSYEESFAFIRDKSKYLVDEFNRITKLYGHTRKVLPDHLKAEAHARCELPANFKDIEGCELMCKQFNEVNLECYTNPNDK
jgi:hypothetical protein